MKEEFQQTLIKKYPKLYKNYHKSIYESAMGWGFMCGDGWYDLIDKLSSQIEPLGAVADQVKEKFGGLRFYVSMPTETADKIRKYVEEAERKSYTICERCGNDGKTINHEGWYYTLCDKCKAQL